MHMPLHMSLEDRVRLRRQAVVDTARALSEEQIGFLEGIRGLVGLGYEMSEDVGHEPLDPDIELLVGVASDLDHLPSAEVRSLCSSAWLDQCDAQERKWKAFYSKDLELVCIRLIRRFSADANGASGVLEDDPEFERRS